MALLVSGILFALSHSAMAETSTSLHVGSTPTKFNVQDFEAIGDVKKDDSQAFLRAWAAACSSNATNPAVFVPGRKQFLVFPVTFKGPCKSTRIGFQISGDIMASEDLDAWSGLDARRWLSFDGIDGLTVWGRGTIHGRGYNWWKQSCKHNPKPGCTTQAPTALSFTHCKDLQVRDINVVRSPQVHITFLGCERVRATGLTIVSPGDSPNTDGIHIHQSRDVFVHDAAISAGDDCISIGNHVFNVKISRIICGPGHGISVGSLGKGESDAAVEGISVRDVQFVGTTNGARIKTWQGGRGYARSISFERIYFTNVENPIIIDQYYCTHSSCPMQPTAVKISDVKYLSFLGTSSTPIAISLNCSNAVGCSSLFFHNINLRSSHPGQRLSSACINAYGKAAGVTNPLVPCLK